MKKTAGDKIERSTKATVIAELPTIDTNCRASCGIGRFLANHDPTFKRLNPSTSPIAANVAVDGPAELWSRTSVKAFDNTDITTSINPKKIDRVPSCQSGRLILVARNMPK